MQWWFFRSTQVTKKRVEVCTCKRTTFPFAAREAISIVPLSGTVTEKVGIVANPSATMIDWKGFLKCHHPFPAFLSMMRLSSVSLYRTLLWTDLITSSCFITVHFWLINQLSSRWPASFRVEGLFALKSSLRFLLIEDMLVYLWFFMTGIVAGNDRSQHVRWPMSTERKQKGRPPKLIWLFLVNNVNHDGIHQHEILSRSGRSVLPFDAWCLSSSYPDRYHFYSHLYSDIFIKIFTESW